MRFLLILIILLSLEIQTTAAKPAPIPVSPPVDWTYLKCSGSPTTCPRFSVGSGGDLEFSSSSELSLTAPFIQSQRAILILKANPVTAPVALNLSSFKGSVVRIIGLNVEERVRLRLTGVPPGAFRLIIKNLWVTVDSASPMTNTSIEIENSHLEGDRASSFPIGSIRGDNFSEILLQPGVPVKVSQVVLLGMSSFGSNTTIETNYLEVFRGTIRGGFLISENGAISLSDVTPGSNYLGWATFNFAGAARIGVHNVRTAPAASIWFRVTDPSVMQATCSNSAILVGQSAAAGLEALFNAPPRRNKLNCNFFVLPEDQSEFVN